MTSGPELERVAVCAIGDVPVNGMRRFEVRGRSVLVANVNGDFYAIGDTCTHSEASLADGMLDCEGRSVECPLHGSIFDLKSGAALEYPAERPVDSYATEVEGDALFLMMGRDPRG